MITCVLLFAFHLFFRVYYKIVRKCFKSCIRCISHVVLHHLATHGIGDNLAGLRRKTQSYLMIAKSLEKFIPYQVPGRALG